MSSPSESMRALITDPATESGFRLADVPRPVPQENEVLIAVEFASINFLDIAYSAQRLTAGSIPGVDSAGVVVTGTQNGSGPTPGSKVAAFAGAAWAQYQAVPIELLATIPNGVPLEIAAALPAAGVTAVQILRALGSLVGKQVLVTGASGGVGHLAVQLAARSGALVTALVSNAARAREMAPIPGVRVISDLDECEHVDGIVDLVGGQLLADAFTRLAEGGRALSVGQASLQPTTLDFETERNRASNRWLSPFSIAPPFTADLQSVLRLCAQGAVEVSIGWHGRLADADQAVTAFRERRVSGKAVLIIGGRSGSE